MKETIASRIHLITAKYLAYVVIFIQKRSRFSQNCGVQFIKTQKRNFLLRLRPSRDRLTRPFQNFGQMQTLLPHRIPPHHFCQRHRLTIRRVHNLTRHRNHNPLPPRPLKPILHSRFHLCRFRLSPLLASSHKHSLRRLDPLPSPYRFFEVGDVYDKPLRASTYPADSPSTA
jgi:hypothetical protein